LQYFLSSFLWNSDKMLGTFWPRFCGISVLHCPGSFLATFVLLFFSTLLYGFDPKKKNMKDLGGAVLWRRRFSLLCWLSEASRRGG
jgi:hypothetical protein